MPSCNTYRLTSVSLTLDEGYLLTAALPDLQCGIAPLGPPVPAQTGRGVAPPSRRPLSWTWGSSSWPFLPCHSLAVLAAAPDLGRGVAPLSRALCAIAAAHALKP